MPVPPSLPTSPSSPVAAGQAPGPAATLALALEHARVAMERGETPDAALKPLFLEALARMIHDAMQAEHGDPVFQAMVLRHRLPRVREYASLSAHADRDQRRVRAMVDAVAHPGKAQARGAGPERMALARLHALASSAAWAALADSARHLAGMPRISSDAPLLRGLQKLLDDPALARLQRVAELASDEAVQRHQALLDRNGPRAGSPEASAQGWTTQRRGAAVEASAARVLAALAQRLNDTEQGHDLYRVVTSMRVPASIPGNAERAKSEWDAVLLRRAPPLRPASDHEANLADDFRAAAAPGTPSPGIVNEKPSAPAGAPCGLASAPRWDICLLVEAKASIDAAATDFPRLLRGLRLLAHADATSVYPFETQQGVVCLRGASLKALKADADDPAGTVLYCCDVPTDTSTRVLSAASRMQLLCAQGSLVYASRLAEQQSVAHANGRGERRSVDHANGLADQQSLDYHDLEPVWDELLASPRWHGVLHQYATLRRARALMVNVEDLAAAIDGAA
ncbi:3-deoxy-D-arabino-heptulosonate 7-phosphate synthase [Bordetella sp. H567]|uniref:3-deoxy-D-arabino-heptulosonate 7-phosphate synthase n=1 Tax=Bordetella sp. H567 TaxID=1697043 RepID=UPI003FCC2A60